MTRHIFDAKLDDQPMQITVGYDVGSCSFYLHIGWLDAQTGSVAAYASDLCLAYDPRDWRTIRRFLETLHIQAPVSVWRELAYDGVARHGSRVVRHASDGTMCEITLG